jgi:hypothetical protein
MANVKANIPKNIPSIEKEDLRGEGELSWLN